MQKKISFSILLYAVFCFAASLTVITMLSPRNRHRPALEKPRYLILHTTEGGTQGSLSTLHKDGKIHYMVTPEGKVYRIMDEGRMAVHAGRSLWQGRPRLDEISIGIEVVGFHNRMPTTEQIKTLGELISDIKTRHRIPDDHILTHSQVAYGSPNQWQPRNHRGRKRCGMLMATPELRRRLGINSEPRIDPDVTSGKLAIGDPYLNKVIYGNANDSFQSPRIAQSLKTVTPQQIVKTIYSGPQTNVIGNGRSAWFIARDQYDSPRTIYTTPDGTKTSGDKVRNWKKLPDGTKINVDGNMKMTAIEFEDARLSARIFKEVLEEGTSALSIARDEAASPTTYYLIPNQPVMSGEELRKNSDSTFWNLPKGTRILVGYKKGQSITKDKSAYRISQESSRPWNSPLTIYRFPDGRVMTGDEIDPRFIQSDTLIFLEN